MEIRGIGIIDIEELFGIRAIRLQKRIEVEVNLTLWSESEEYERLGLEDKKTEDARLVPLLRLHAYLAVDRKLGGLVTGDFGVIDFAEAWWHR